MQIKGIDFEKCESLYSWVDFINSQPSVHCMNSDRDWEHNRIYIYEGECPMTLYGMILLRKQHGKYDGPIIQQELKNFFNRQCIHVQFTEVDANKLSLIAVERHEIVVDSNKTLVPFFWGKSSMESQAKELKAVSHYTEATNAIKILTKNIFIGKSLSRYKSEIDFVANENSRRLYFICCFSTKLMSDDLMWKNFADKHRGCKIDFVFKHTFADAFPLNGLIKCQDEQGNQYEIPSGFNRIEGSTFPVFFTTHYSMVQYTADRSNKATLQVYDNGGVEDFTISSYVGKDILKNFEYQHEARILLRLNSFHQQIIPFIQKVEIPFLPDEIEQIVLTIGRDATDKTQSRIIDALGNSHNITIKYEVS